MTLLRRRPRTVYRVYTEEEYLAGVDPFADANVSRADATKRGRRLQRIAGAAALTGAVGTVGGVVAAVGLRTHTVDRPELAARLVPSVRTAPRGSVSSAYRTHRHVAHGSRPRHTRPHARPVRVATTPAPAPRTPARPVAEMPARASTTGVPRDTSAPVASASRGAPAEAEPRPRAQDEFGFER